MYRHLSDLELAATFRQLADNQIIGELYMRYRRDVYRYGVYCNYKYCQNSLNRDVLEDFTTDVFTRLFQQLIQYEITSNFKSWLIRSAHNLFMDMLKKESRYVYSENDIEIEKKIDHEVENESFERLLSIDTLTVGTDVTVEGIIAVLNNRKVDINGFLGRCIEHINNAEQRICLYQFYIEQHTYKEISQLTGFDLKKVKSALQHGKRALQNTVITLVKQFES